MRSSFKILLLGLAFTVFSGCGTLQSVSDRSQTLGNILAPVKDSLVTHEKKPLVFPSNVAILMIPGDDHRLIPISTLTNTAEQLKKNLLKNKKYVRSVSIVSTSDIDQKITLNAIHDLYAADIVVIISYQQDQRKKQSNAAALFDFAIIPVFIIPGVKVTTTTIVDSKIIHIPSNAIIFRSSATNERTAHMTRFTAEQRESNKESIKGLTSAIDQLGKNMSTQINQLDKFDISSAVSLNEVMSEQIKSNENGSKHGDNWSKVDSYKNSGAGSLGCIELILLALAALL